MNVASRTLVVLLFAIFRFEHPVSAAIIVSYSSSTDVPLVASSGATLDVYVRSSDGTDILDGFQMEFALIPTGGAPIGGLEFVDPQSDSQLTDPTYVFAGRSLSFITGAPVGAVFAANTRFTGADFTDDGSAAPDPGLPHPLILGTLDQLLFRLDLFAETAGNYELHVITADFADADAVLLPIESLPSPAMLTVSGAAAAVPEPGTFALLSCLAGAFIARRFRAPPCCPS